MVTEGADSIDCERFSELIDEYYDGMLDAELHAAMEAHAQNCGACAAQWEAHRRLMEDMELLRTQKEPPAGFHAEWVQAVQREGLRAKRMRFRMRMASAAAALVFLLSIGVFIRTGTVTAPEGVEPVADMMQAQESTRGTVTHLETAQPDVHAKDISLQGTTAVQTNGNELFAGAGEGVTGSGVGNTSESDTAVPDTVVEDAAARKTVVLRAKDTQKAVQDLLGLAGRNGIAVERAGADIFLLEINPVSRPVIAPWLSGYTDEALSRDEVFMLQISIEQG